MKSLITALFLVASFSASAQMVNVYPQIFNFGNSVQVQVNNTTDSNINCSGWVYMNTFMGRMESNYYSDYLPKGRVSMRMFHLMNFQDRVTFAHHSIYCNKAP